MLKTTKGLFIYSFIHLFIMHVRVFILCGGGVLSILVFLVKAEDQE